MDAYKDWIRQNRQWVASLESIANTLTWFLPERFTNSEIGAEAVAALLGLVTVMNQHIIETAPQSTEQMVNVPGNRVHAPTTDQQGFFSLPLCLSAVKELEVLIEVAAEYYEGRDRKWNVLAAVEAIKACLRLIILHGSGYKMLFDGGETKHVEEGHVASCTERVLAGISAERWTDGRQTGYFSPGYAGHGDATRSSLPQDLEGKALLALTKFGESFGVKEKPSWVNRQQILSEKSLELEGITGTSKPSLFSIWKQNGLVGELPVVGEWLFILRPLIYVLLIRRYGLRSWKPWLTSFAIDVTGMSAILFAAHLIKRKSVTAALSDEHKCLHDPLSRVELQELKRRQMLWVLYLMRDPFFTKYSRYPLDNTERILRPVPLIGFLAGKAVEFVSGIQTRYSYTSAS